MARIWFQPSSRLYLHHPLFRKMIHLQKWNSIFGFHAPSSSRYFLRLMRYYRSQYMREEDQHQILRHPYSFRYWIFPLHSMVLAPKKIFARRIDKWWWLNQCSITHMYMHHLSSGNICQLTSSTLWKLTFFGVFGTSPELISTLGEGSLETQQVLRDFALELLDSEVSLGTLHTSLFFDCSSVVIESFSRSIDSNMAEKE